MMMKSSLTLRYPLPVNGTNEMVRGSLFMEMSHSSSLCILTKDDDDSSESLSLLSFPFSLSDHLIHPFHTYFVFVLLPFIASISFSSLDTISPLNPLIYDLFSWVEIKRKKGVVESQFALSCLHSLTFPLSLAPISSLLFSSHHKEEPHELF